jgi:hypothetical protein
MKRNKNMIKGISDLDYCESKRIIQTILERVRQEEEDLRRETDEKMIEILIHEYQRRLSGDKNSAAQTEKRIEACNTRMREIERELFEAADRKNYFEVQLEMLGEKRNA